MNNLIEVNIQKKYRLPIIVLVNGILYFIIFVQKGIHAESILYCFMTTILIKISVLDEKTKKIPIKWNLLLMIIGILFTIMDKQHISSHLWGMMGTSACLILLYIFLVHLSLLLNHLYAFQKKSLDQFQLTYHL